MSKLSFQPVIHRLLTAMLSKSSPLNMLRCVRLGDCQTDQPVVLDQQVSIALKACPGTAAADADWSQEFSTNELQTNLSMVSKILQRLVLPHVLPHLFGSPTFSQYQSAYRKVYSTETALLDVLNGVYMADDDRQASVLISLDLSARFDTVDHSLLIERLKS